MPPQIFGHLTSNSFEITMVSSLGLEPRTNALKGRCSTN